MTDLSHLDVIKTDNSRKVQGATEGPDFLVSALRLLDHFLGEGRIQNVDDVGKRGVDDFVVVGQAVELLRLQVEVDAVTHVDAVGVGMSVPSAALKWVKKYLTT